MFPGRGKKKSLVGHVAGFGESSMTTDVRTSDVSQKAVQRYVKYWDKRLADFGVDRAFYDLTIANLTDGERRPLELGAIRILARPKSTKAATHADKKDERDMIYINASKLAPKAYSRQEGLRCLWTLMHTLLAQDVQVQQRGVIFIINVAHFGRHNRDPRLATMCVTAMVGSLPMRLSAVHVCHVAPSHWLLFQVLLIFAGERLRQRVAAHTNGERSVATTLEAKYGIPQTCLPNDFSSCVQTEK
jgi:CRAL/TRIO domain